MLSSGGNTPQSSAFSAQPPDRHLRVPAALDGGRSPCGGPVRLPALAVTRNVTWPDETHDDTDGTSTPGDCRGLTPSAFSSDKQPSSFRLRAGKSASAGSMEKQPLSPGVADVASPLRRRTRRTKTWAAPPAPAGEEPIRSPHSDPPSERRPQRSRTTAAQFLLLDEPKQPPESSPKGPTPRPPAQRRSSRSKTWTAQGSAEGHLTPKGPVLGAPAVETPTKRRDPGCKAWVAQASPAASRLTPSTVSPCTLSLGGVSISSSISDSSRQNVGLGLRWKRGEKIGSGSYGCVHKALDKETGHIFAVKRAVIEDRSDEDQRYRERLEAELSICMDLRHPNIVSYLGHDYADSNLYIYLEYVSGGSLASILSEFGPIEGPLMQMGTRGLLEGLNYMHTFNPPVVHRDIKGANILVDLNFCLKLADFGCSKRGMDTRSFTTVGSIPWMAPEVIQQQDGHGRKADIWSLGCTLIEMATADKPWGRDTFDNMMFALKHIGLSDAVPPIPEVLAAAGQDLIAACVQRSPMDRPWASELLAHEYVAAAGRGGGA